MIVRRLTVIAACALLTTVALATPAHAADTVEVSLSGVSGTINAGSRGTNTVNVTFVNRGTAPITSIQAVFTIQLDGLPVDGVRVVRALGSELSASGGVGSVTFTDPGSFELLRNGRRTLTYQLQFTATAPAGKATITVSASANGTRLGSDSASATIRSNASPAATSTPPNTDPGVVPTFAGGPSVSLAPLDDQAANTKVSSDVPFGLYIMGGLLVAVGGIVLWLLFRRPKAPVYDTVVYPEYDQGRPASLGYPRHSGSLHPTAALPIIRDPEPPTVPGPPSGPGSPGPGFGPGPGFPGPGFPGPGAGVGPGSLGPGVGPGHGVGPGFGSGSPGPGFPGPARPPRPTPPPSR